jgi:hypothetical protein
MQSEPLSYNCSRPRQRVTVPVGAEFCITHFDAFCLNHCLNRFSSSCAAIWHQRARRGYPVCERGDSEVSTTGLGDFNGSLSLLHLVNTKPPASPLHGLS